VTVAVAASLVLHTPPVLASCKVVVLPMQILSGPVMLAGDEFTVTGLLTVQPIPKE
jgi:hypothetical protein